MVPKVEWTAEDLSQYVDAVTLRDEEGNAL
jgi:hypothetical protein